MKNGEGTAETVFNKALEIANISKSDISKITSTGYGRVMLPFADETEIIESAKERSANIVKEKRKLLDDIANTLLEKETIEKEEFDKIMGFKTKDENTEKEEENIE